MQKVSEPAPAAQLVAAPAGRAHRQALLRDRRGRGRGRPQGAAAGPGRGHRRHVFSTGAARLVEDVSRDPSFAPRFDEASAFRTRSMLAVPLIARGRVLGVIELVNGAADPPFTEDDLTALTAIADYAAIAIENARNFRRVQELTITDEHTGVLQRPAPARAAGARGAALAALPPPAVARVPGPGPLQVRQRHARPPGGQRAAQGGGRAARRRAAGSWTTSSATAATSSRCCWWRRARTGR